MYRGTDNGYAHYGAILTQEQVDMLKDQYYVMDSAMFNPIILNDNWVIFLGEIELCENPEFMWVKDLPVVLLIPY